MQNYIGIRIVRRRGVFQSVYYKAGSVFGHSESSRRRVECEIARAARRTTLRRQGENLRDHGAGQKADADHPAIEGSATDEMRTGARSAHDFGGGGFLPPAAYAASRCRARRRRDLLDVVGHRLIQRRRSGAGHGADGSAMPHAALACGPIPGRGEKSLRSRTDV